MEYVNDISIIDAVIHIVDSNNDEPLLNNYKLELTDEIYKFLYKHVEKCFKDEELRYAVFNQERRIVKDLAQDFLNGVETDIVTVSKEFAQQLFYIMRANSSIPSCDLITVYMTTDQGPMLGILKMDYVKNFTHSVDFIEDMLGIAIVEQQAGLPSAGQKVQKCAFIRPIKEDQEVDLMVIDKQRRTKEGEDFGAEYFVDHYLGCTVVANERDMTKSFMKAAENWARTNVVDDAAKAVEVRKVIKSKLKEEDIINVDEIAREAFKEEPDVQRSFNDYMESQGVERDVVIDKSFVEKKLKKVRLNVDKEIDIYLADEAYNDNDKFEIVRNGDGTINIVIKKVKNYIEK
ncbi:MAG: nucleoid-associated protein [Sarcina sp.]